MLYHQKGNSEYNYSYNAVFYDNIFWEAHFHRNFELIYALSGEIDCAVNGRRETLREGQFGMCLSNEAHEYRSVGDSLSWVAVFSGDFVHEFEKKTKNKAGDGFIFTCSEPVKDFLLKELIREEPPEKLLLKSCLYAVCSEYLRSISLSERSSKNDIMMRGAADIISERFRSRLTLDDLSRELGYDRYYISRCMMKSFGTSFSDAVNSMRMEYALTLLTETEKNITVIALESGFQSIRNFNSVFIRRTGVSPSEYRRQIGKTK